MLKVYKFYACEQDRNKAKGLIANQTAFFMAEKTATPSLRGSETTEAIHKHKREADKALQKWIETLASKARKDRDNKAK